MSRRCRGARNKEKPREGFAGICAALHDFGTYSNWQYNLDPDPNAVSVPEFGVSSVALTLDQALWVSPSPLKEEGVLPLRREVLHQLRPGVRPA